MSGADAIAVVVVTYNSAAKLGALAGSLAAQLGDGDQLVIVDNASADGTVALARSLPGQAALVIETRANRGFAAACRLGVDATRTPLIALINPDTLVGEGALERLRAVARERPDWSAWQPAVMLPDGRINTAGGVVHYLGMGWAGRCGHDAGELPVLPYEAAFPSGAALVVRRSAWLELDGMRDDYFLYGEDLDLGLRLWLAGHRVGVEPRARVIHDYEFDKGANKWFLLERNRWRTVLATYPAPLLAALAPVLLLAELAIIAVAARDGWLLAKLRAQAATLTGLPAALRRRRVVQRARRVSAAEFAQHLSGAFDSRNIVVPRTASRASRAYWGLVRWLLRYDRASVARPCR
jgi:N-acetylglucosaminyl-diphospho-decaprenol L-rhamnosyltransferase